MEALAVSAAASFLSGVNHSMAYQVAGKLLLSMEAIIAIDITHPDIKKILIELDVRASLSTIKALLSDLKPILNSCGSTIKVCFDNLNNVVNQIQNELETVENKCKLHKKSYWSYVYTYPDVTNELKQIKNLKNIMDHRIDLLTKSATIELQLLSINHSNKKNKNDKNDKNDQQNDKQ